MENQRTESMHEHNDQLLDPQRTQSQGANETKEDATKPEEPLPALPAVVTRLAKMPLAGHCCVLIACILQTLTVSIVKVLEDVDPFLIMTCRAFIIVSLAGPMALWNYRRQKRNKLLLKSDIKTPDESDQRKKLSTHKIFWLLFFRALFMSISVCMIYNAVRHMPLGDLRMIVASTPAFVAIFSRIFLKEACGIFQVTTMIVTLIGVVIVMQPPFVLNALGIEQGEDEAQLETHFITGAIALAAAVLQALGAVATTALKDVDTFLISFASSAVGIVVGLSASGISRGLISPSWLDQFYILLSGLSSFMAQTFMITAIKLDDATSMSLARKSEDILAGFVVQIAYFGEVPSVLVVLGAALISVCIVLSGVRKLLQAKDSQDLDRRWAALFCIDRQTQEKKVFQDDDAKDDCKPLSQP